MFKKTPEGRLKELEKRRKILLFIKKRITNEIRVDFVEIQNLKRILGQTKKVRYKEAKEKLK